MTTLNVTARGQVTFRKDILQHLGIQPGGQIRLDLLRLIVGDDAEQRDRAAATLQRAERVAFSVHALCEFVRVLEWHYGMRRPDTAAAIRRILKMRNVVANRPAVEAGLEVLDAGATSRTA